MLNHGNTV